MITDAGIYVEDKDDFVQPVQHGPIVPSVHPVTKSLLFAQTLRQFAKNFAAKPWSTPGPNGSWLVEETAGRDKDAGIVEWQRLFAQVPAARSEYESVSHSYQYITDGDTPDLAEVARTVRMRIDYTYFHVPSGNPTSAIAVSQAYRYFKLGNTIYQIGTVINGVVQEILHEDETYSRWKANIFEKVSKKVPFYNFSQSGQ